MARRDESDAELDRDQPIEEKYSLDPLGSGFIVFSPGVQFAGQTSSGFDWTYWKA